MAGMRAEFRQYKYVYNIHTEQQEMIAWET